MDRYRSFASGAGGVTLCEPNSAGGCGREAEPKPSTGGRPIRSRNIRTEESRRHQSIRRYTMKNQTQTTLRDRDGPNTYRKTATTIGVIYSNTFAAGK